MQLSVILVEYFFSEEELGACFQNLKISLSPLSFEICVVSNSAYEKDRQESLRKNFSEVRWIFNSQNAGFAKAVNQGLQAARGDFLLVMNVDVRLQSPIADAVHWMQQHPEIGVVGPQIRDEASALQDSCRPFMTLFDFLGRGLKRLFSSLEVLLDKNFDYQKMQPVDWVIGAFLLISRKAFTATGGMDEGYFFYVEDMDWCFRFWQKGFQVWYFPPLQVIYRGDRKSQALFKGNPGKIKFFFHHLKSYARFVRKNGFFAKRSS